MQIKKTLLVSALALALVAPGELAAFNGGSQLTVNAAKKHHPVKHGKKTLKKHPKKKAAKKKRVQKGKKKSQAKRAQSTTTPTTQPTQATQSNSTASSQPAPTSNLSSDATAYNNAVSNLGPYAKAGGQNTYTVGPNTSYPEGNSTAIRNSLNALVNDMGNSDSYDALLFGNGAAIAFQQQVNQLYRAFQTRFSADDNNVLKNEYNAVQQQWVNRDTDKGSVNVQWNNLVNFLSSLSNAFSKLPN